MPTSWFCKINGNERGPLSSSQLKDWAQRGLLTSETPVRRDSETNWTTAAKVSGLLSDKPGKLPPLREDSSLQSPLAEGPAVAEVPRPARPNGFESAITDGMSELRFQELPPREQPSPAAPRENSREASSKPAEARLHRVISEAQGYAIIALLVIAVCASFIGFLMPPRASKWEYMIVSPSDITIESEMQRHGSSGWELVFARRASSGSSEYSSVSYEMIFKRPKGL